MEKEQIIKALECCTNPDVDSCSKCPIYPFSLNMTQTECMETAMRNALALIKELTEENERLNAELSQRPKKLIITKKRKCESEE